MPERTAVVVIFDRLGAGFLGPYGNTWIETPGWNELAAESLLLEQMWVDTPALPGLYRSMWTGGHASFRDLPARSLPQRLADRGDDSLLLTDEPALAQHPLASGFGRIQLLDVPEVTEAAEHPEETQLGRLTAAALEVLSHHPPPLVWIHSQGMQGAWDAPWEFRQQFADEEDPPAPQETMPPRHTGVTDVDPDWLQGWLWAYAGQIHLLDLCVEQLLVAIQASSRTLWAVQGARGYPLGEHGGFGDLATGLGTELLQVPLLIRSPEHDLAARRCQHLIQPAHLYATLCDWLGLPDSAAVSARSLLRWAEGDEDLGQPLAVCADLGQWALRTPPWFAQWSPTRQESGRWQLFLKPDDRWDVNDVADRCPHVVEAFGRLLTQVQTACDLSSWQSLEPLDERLLSRGS